MTHVTLPSYLSKSVRKPLTLFWRLFLSMLAILLLTSVLSVAIERWINTQELNNRMQHRVEQLVSDKEIIALALQNNDFNQIRALYRSNRELAAQIRILDEQGIVIFPNFRHFGQRSHQYDERPHPSSPSSSLSRPSSAERPPRPPVPNTLIEQISVDEQRYPELADLTVTAGNGSRYTIQLQPRIPMRDLLSLRKDHTVIRFSLILIFSILVCYWLSQALTRRIKRVQQAVHSISDGQFKAGEALTDLGNDELGMLAKDVAKLSTRLAESELARKQMLSDISHELRSPLARLDIATELTRDFAPQANHYLDRIQKESTRMNELIEQIIRIQSLQMRQYSLDIEAYQPINLFMLLDEIRQDVCFEFQDKGIAWHWHHTDGPDTNITLHGDEQQLHSAFENIIRNAFHHTPANTSVMVALQTDAASKDYQGLVNVQIIDAGTGVDDEDLERIFHPFVRLTSSRERIVTNPQDFQFKASESKTMKSKVTQPNVTQPNVTQPNKAQLNNKDSAAPKYEGYGLGLAIARAIIRAHKGQLTAYNRI